MLSPAAIPPSTPAWRSDHRLCGANERKNAPHMASQAPGLRTLPKSAGLAHMPAGEARYFKSDLRGRTPTIACHASYGASLSGPGLQRLERLPQQGSFRARWPSCLQSRRLPARGMPSTRASRCPTWRSTMSASMTCCSPTSPAPDWIPRCAHQRAQSDRLEPFCSGLPSLRVVASCMDLLHTSKATRWADLYA